MAAAKQLPCNNDGVCMLCKATPTQKEKVLCISCLAQWHETCLTKPPKSLEAELVWECPDHCTAAAGALTDVPVGEDAEPVVAGALTEVPVGEDAEPVAAVGGMEEDSSLTEGQKADKRQDAGDKGKGKMAEEMMEEEDDERTESDSDINLVDIEVEEIRCAICLQSPERPVMTPCGHNFCLNCFDKWVSQRRSPICPRCHRAIPPTVARNAPLILTLATPIRQVNVSTSEQQPQGTSSQLDRPDTAFTTERAKKPGLANASSGRILVTVPRDHFGPITSENDPKRNQGVLVGEYWKSRMEVRQWGVHIAHISGISGQSKNGAQSVVLSGGYADDEDHGDWFLYTGSGGRDLTGNRRTNKSQSSDQRFAKCNESLRLSCRKGYPVRVVRAYKNKRSVYSPKEGYRYDGIYRIERCWRKVGVQGFLICRYLFIRCDNEPAPWTTSEACGDRPRPAPFVPELQEAIDVCEREETPSWDFDEVEACWMWKKPPPLSKERITNGDAQKRKRGRKNKDNSFKCLVPERSNDKPDFLDNCEENTEQMDLTEKLQSGSEKNVEASELSDGNEEVMEEVEALLGESDDEEEA